MTRSKAFLVTLAMVMTALVSETGCRVSQASTIQTGTATNLRTISTGQTVITSNPSSTGLITILYSGTQSEQPSVGIFDIPKSGYIYEIVSFTITNTGYDSFSTYPLNFYITVKGTEYVYDNATYDLPDPLPNVAVQNGETASGSLAYQVPVGTAGFTPVYKGPGAFNIKWVSQ